MTNTGHKASSYLICTQSAFTMSTRHWAPCQLWDSFWLALKFSEHNQWNILLQYLNKMLTSIKHVVDEILTFNRTVHCCILCVTQPNFSSFNYGLYDPPFSNIAMNPTVCKSTRLKTSESYWLKSCDIGYIIWMIKCDFCVFPFCQVVQSCCLGEVGK